jgi:hypothetical protein
MARILVLRGRQVQPDVVARASFRSWCTPRYRSVVVRDAWPSDSWECVFVRC